MKRCILLLLLAGCSKPTDTPQGISFTEVETSIAPTVCGNADPTQIIEVDLEDFDVFLMAYDDMPADCNSNGVVDMLDILLGEPDNDNNGVPDDCQGCTGDLNGDNALGVGDLLAIIATWGTCLNCAADINNDGAVDVTDLLYIVGNWGPCS